MAVLETFYIPFSLVSVFLFLLTVNVSSSMAASLDSSNSLIRDMNSNEEQRYSDSYTYRSHTDDSFARIPGNSLISESTIQFQGKSFKEFEDDFVFVPLTFESLSKFQEIHLLTSDSAVSKAPSSSLTDLLHIKRTSSLKSLNGVSSDAATDSWLIPSTQRLSSKAPASNDCHFFPNPPIPEAPTESNSTVTSSMNSAAQIPPNLKSLLDIRRFTESLLEYLKPNDLIKLLMSNSAILKFLKDYLRAAFNSPNRSSI